MTWRAFFLAGLGLLASGLGSLAPGAQPTTSQPIVLEALVLDVQGQVEVRRIGVTNWLPLQAQQVLQIKDQVRTGENSFMSVRVGSRMPVRFGEKTDFIFQAPAAPTQPSRLNLLRGLLYFFGREKPAWLQMDSPVCSTAIRGTEFVLEVQAPECWKNRTFPII